jgi:hypothetical protein
MVGAGDGFLVGANDKSRGSACRRSCSILENRGDMLLHSGEDGADDDD